ncbi:hypothetical protein [Actinomadura violacea]|uniref:Uncharacterized protein n=1 Tax=Actinomadura violacea TaxID=2819934 RepID=A0ABS3RSQ4_9ACTN|nr:hypothetical protein [Actinomadura violacea]MBO2459779.1 hypothetical protein [Actinomadura violacea]
MSWEFGETVKLPDPFGLEITTDEWEPWQRSWAAWSWRRGGPGGAVV